MKQLLVLTATALLATSMFAADVQSDVKAAIKKLSDSSGYSWKNTMEFNGGGGNGGANRRGPGATEGKVNKDGLIYLKVSVGEGTTEVLVKGEKGAIKTGDTGWRSLADQPPAADANNNGGQRRNFGGFGRFYRNYKAPAAQAEDLLGKTKDLKAADGVISGDLTEEGVKELARFGGRGGGGGNNTEVNSAKGSIKFWVKDGALSKYEFHVHTKFTIQGNDREIDRKTTVEIKDVGTTKVDAPEAALKLMTGN